MCRLIYIVVALLFSLVCNCNSSNNSSAIVSKKRNDKRRQRYKIGTVVDMSDSFVESNSLNATNNIGKKISLSVTNNRTLFLNLGQGTTGTHGIHSAFCSAKLRACHFYLACPERFSSRAMQRHKDVIELQVYAHRCLDSAASVGPLRDRFARRELDCDAINWQRKFRAAVDALIKDLIADQLDGYSDTPVTGIIRHILQYMAVHRSNFSSTDAVSNPTAATDSGIDASNGIYDRREVRFIVTTRDAQRWAERRVQGHSAALTCRHDTAAVTGRVSNPLGDYIECVSAAQQHLGSSSFHLDAAFRSIKRIPLQQLTAMMEHYQTVYVQEVMAHYAAAVGSKIRLGHNLLLVNYFNTSINFKNVSTIDKMERGIADFLQRSAIPTIGS